MPAWNELLNETRATGSAHDVIRRKYLKRLNRLTKRNAIIYYSGWLQKPELVRERSLPFGISDADKNGFMSVIKGLDRKKGLDLILHTPGGDMAATESLVDYLRAMIDDDIRAIITQLAKTRGTIIDHACREIVMGKESSIGPIDPQFGSMAAVGLLQEFERVRQEIKNDPSSVLLWQPILSKLEPGFVTECENAVEWSHEMAKRFLETNMFKGVKGKDEKIKQIVSKLTDKKNTKSHGRHIGLDEAKQIFGDKIVLLEADQRLQDAVLTVHHAAIITLQATPAFKMIENHTGRAFMQTVKVQMVGTPG